MTMMVVWNKSGLRDGECENGTLIKPEIFVIVQDEMTIC